MADFEYYKQFIVPNKETVQTLKHNFFYVSREALFNAEKKLGFPIPSELRQFYREIGYGKMFLHEEHSFNIFFAPSTITAIHLREDHYSDDPDLEIYTDTNKLIFFQVNEGIYLTIDVIEKNNQSCIYYFNAKIADSLQEFLSKIEVNSSYFEDYEVQ